MRTLLPPFEVYNGLISKNLSSLNSTLHMGVHIDRGFDRSAHSMTRMRFDAMRWSVDALTSERLPRSSRSDLIFAEGLSEKSEKSWLLISAG